MTVKRRYVMALPGPTSSLQGELLPNVEGEPLLNNVITHPEHQRLGYAKLALSYALNSLAAAGHTRAVWYVTSGNTASEALSQSRGAVCEDSYPTELSSSRG
ncbi:MAG TPA: GNAT family N-acetyltransferase [Ornithinimicrobium sp.]|uniref:GNAT family N-acetyltransferase n=1 Tax=Ornithinimicrobium sp. TaxID=1977084 RepID=UPI002B465B33|nr:GNAT family N-acetyltransferase [Ornithinimicrobium sp.]HKJ10872.1 GNAT family N-acetyltransferase [Ornithinimicrobium sp.]